MVRLNDICCIEQLDSDGSSRAASNFSICRRKYDVARLLACHTLFDIGPALVEILFSSISYQSSGLCMPYASLSFPKKASGLARLLGSF